MATECNPHARRKSASQKGSRVNDILTWWLMDQESEKFSTPPTGRARHF